MLVRRKAGTTPEAFRAHYEEVHAPLAQSLLVGLRKYVRSYPATVMTGGDAGFDAITELHFNDEAAFHAASAVAQSPAGQVLADDEETFMDRAATVAMIVDERSSDMA